ncbi:MAG: molecular chaperone HtpG [Candidatus Accumulibacter sp.]|jgi:molecular chaperone HtpG|nr:molecular chaperone HtpG [Accumulibacter sp.]
MSAETHSFQAEVKQLLNLMIHSLYSNKEIFLRELISNASDACDKLRFEALDNPALYGDDAELKIRLSFDKDARTVTVSDNGIGLTRDEAIEHLGTIAKSGTQEFFSSLTGDQAKDAHLIGQFGVGFYSSYIVADKVTVVSRRAGVGADQAVRWESAGEGEFSVEAVEKSGRGTDVILHLREEEDEFLSGWKLRQVVRKYSDHITLPIVMKKEKWDEEKKAQVVSEEDETINQASALWARPKSEIDDAQYKEFYKHVAHDFEEPLAYTHAKVEGKQEYTQLLYIPQHAPFDLWDRHARHGVKLYVRRVFIMDDAEQLMPLYLRFVRGIVDSNDLPLNVSREILQESRDIEAIRGGCVKRVLSLLEGMADSEDAAEKEKYTRFWTEFGQVLKEGVGEDATNKDRIAKLLRFASTHADTTDESVSLADYVSRMKEGQEKIYFVTAESFTAAKNSPHLEIFRKKGIEVLLLSERVDEWVVGYLTEFDGKSLQSVAKGGLDLGKLEDEAEKQEVQAATDEYKDLIEKIKKALDEKVKDVRITHRLTDSPSCIVADEHDMGGNLARILKATGQKAPEARPILEINPKHPVVLRLKYEGSDPGSRFDDWANLLLEQAMLAEGGTLDDPAGFVKRINALMLEMSGGH